MFGDVCSVTACAGSTRIPLTSPPRAHLSADRRFGAVEGGACARAMLRAEWRTDTASRSRLPPFRDLLGCFSTIGAGVDQHAEPAFDGDNSFRRDAVPFRALQPRSRPFIRHDRGTVNSYVRPLLAAKWPVRRLRSRRPARIKTGQTRTGSGSPESAAGTEPLPPGNGVFGDPVRVSSPGHTCYPGHLVGV